MGTRVCLPGECPTKRVGHGRIPIPLFECCVSDTGTDHI